MFFQQPVQISRAVFGIPVFPQGQGGSINTGVIAVVDLDRHIEQRNRFLHLTLSRKDAGSRFHEDGIPGMDPEQTVINIRRFFKFSQMEIADSGVFIQVLFQAV